MEHSKAFKQVDCSVFFRFFYHFPLSLFLSSFFYSICSANAVFLYLTVIPANRWRFQYHKLQLHLLLTKSNNKKKICCIKIKKQNRRNKYLITLDSHAYERIIFAFLLINQHLSFIHSLEKNRTLLLLACVG